MPTQELVRKIKQQIIRKADYVFFFERLRSAAWVQPLLAEGFFKQPPSREEAEGGVRFPVWPESRFLARVAQEAPEIVVDVAAQIPDTENPRVNEDLISIAIQVPPCLAERLVDKALKALESPHSHWQHENYGRLVSHLANGGGQPEAFRLARKLLEFLPDPEAGRKRLQAQTDELDFSSQLRPQPRFEVYSYGEILKRIVPDLRAVAPLATTELLCAILNGAIALGKRNPEETSWDGSVYWFPSFEGISRQLSHDHKTLVAASLFTTIEAILGRDAEQFAAIELLLDKHKWRIFQRLLLHFSQRYPEQGSHRIRGFLLNFRAHEGPEFDREMFLLMKQRFGLLTRQEQRQVVRSILEGPDTELYKSCRRSWSVEATEQEIKDYACTWTVQRLFPIEVYLTEEERLSYAELLKLTGEPSESSYFHFPGTPIPENVTWGPHSPRSAEELASKNPQSVLEFLKTWKPEKGFNAPRPEGLARALQDAVKQRPQTFSARANMFIGIEPTYVRGLIEGLRQAVKEQRPVDWNEAIALCSWVVRQPVEIEGRRVETWDWENGDPSWREARRAIAGLIEYGSSTPNAGIPFSLRSQVFGILEILTEDQDPSPEDEEKSNWRHQPATLAINTVRGRAMHALMRHALWVDDNLCKTGHNGAGLAAMPEVRSILERRLNPQIEPTGAVRSVYGQYFPLLCQIDPQWTKEHLVEIFPVEEVWKGLRDASWFTYVAFNQPHPAVFRILQNEYARAVSCLPEDKGTEHDLNDPDESLAEHLITLYWRGVLDSQPPGLLTGFFERANDRLRAHPVFHVGRCLCECKGGLPNETRERLMKFWSWRLEEAKQRRRNRAPDKELLAFSWWLESEEFDASWALEQTAEVLSALQGAR